MAARKPVRSSSSDMTHAERLEATSDLAAQNRRLLHLMSKAMGRGGLFNRAEQNEVREILQPRPAAKAEKPARRCPVCFAELPARRKIARCPLCEVLLDP